MHKCRSRQDAGCDPCQTGVSTPQTQGLIISRALSFAAALIAATAFGAPSLAREPLFQVGGAFLDAAVRENTLYLLADGVAPGEPDILVLRLGADNGARQVGSYMARHPPLALSASAGWLYLTEGDAGLEVVDLRETAHPRRVARLSLDGYSHQMRLQGNIALVASGFGGLHLLDIRNPAKPVLLSSFQAYPSPLDARGDPEPEAPVAEEEPPAPSLFMTGSDAESDYFRADDLPAYEGMEEEITPHDIRDREGALDVAVEGTFAYLAYGSAGVVILDISDPRSPRRIGGYPTQQPAERIAAGGGRVYVSAGVQGLLILDVAAPARPQLLGRLRSRCYPMGVAVKDDLVYLADGLCNGTGLLVIDVRNAAAPRVLKRLSGPVVNVRVLGERVVSLGIRDARGYSTFSP